MLLKNKVVVITGASSGIGKALAFEFAGVGAKVYSTPEAAFEARKPLKLLTPTNEATYNSLFGEWKILLEAKLQKT